MIIRMIDPAVADEIAAAPEMADDILLPKTTTTPPAARGQFSFLKKQPEPQVLVDWDRVYNQPDVIDLDKSFEALHYLLTGGAQPFEDGNENWWICPGDQHHVGTDAQDGFLISQNEVPKFLKAVQEMDENVMRDRFNPEAMCEMPVGMITWTDDPEGNFVYLLNYRNKLLEFLQKAREDGKALLSGILL